MGLLQICYTRGLFVFGTYLLCQFFHGEHLIQKIGCGGGVKKMVKGVGGVQKYLVNSKAMAQSTGKDPECIKETQN